MSALLTGLAVVAAVVATLLAALVLLPWRASLHVTGAPRVTARVGWPIGLLAVGWRSGHPGVTLWAGRRARTVRPRPEAPRPPRRRERVRRAAGRARALWSHRATGPGVLRLVRAVLRTVRLRAEGRLALTWDDPFLVCQAEGVRLALEGAAGRPTGWLSVAIGRPALDGELVVRMTVWLPRTAWAVIRWLLSADGRAALRAARALRARTPKPPTRGGSPWSSSRTSSGASPTA